MLSQPQGGPATTPITTATVIDWRSLCESFNQELWDRPVVYLFGNSRRFIDSGPYGAFYTGPSAGDDS